MMPPANTPANDGVDLLQVADRLAHRCELTNHSGVAFRRWGGGPPLVLIHGGVGSWTHWIRNIDALAQRFGVLALDLPGFGSSADVPTGMSEDGYLDWVALAVSEAVDGGSVDIAGFSFGGTVAAAVAARLGALGRRLSIIAPGGFGEPVGRQIPLKPRPKDERDVAALHDVLAFNLGQWMLSDAPAADDPVVQIHKSNLARARYDSRRIGWRSTLLEDIAAFHAPVQIVWGDGDRLAHPSVLDRLAHCRVALPDIGLEVVSECGHWAQFEKPEQINAWLLRFHSDRTCPALPVRGEHASSAIGLGH
jgi:2-hydroxy-6-oxonona-2,4-dienedioate hydrolase